MECYSAIKKNTFESVLMKWVKLEPIIQSEVSQKEKDPYTSCLQETNLKTRDTYRLKVKGWRKIFHANGDQKKAGIASLISDKIDFEIKAVKRDKDDTT